MTSFDHLRRRHVTLLVLAFSTIAPVTAAQTFGTATNPVPAETSTASAPKQPQAVTTSGASADTATRVAELWRRGNGAWDERRYADAIVDYEEAAKLSQHPKAFYNLAQSYQRVGRKADALAWFLRFKAKASRDELEDVPNLDKRIAALRNQVAVLKVNVNVVGARVLVRDAVVGTKPPDGPLEVSLNEGRATVEVNSEGYQPYRKEFTLQGGSALEIEVQLNQKAPPTTVVEETKTFHLSSKPLWSQWWFWAGAGALLAGGVTAVVLLSTDKPTANGDAVMITSQPTPFRVHFLAFRSPRGRPKAAGEGVRQSMRFLPAPGRRPRWQRCQDANLICGVVVASAVFIFNILVVYHDKSTNSSADHSSTGVRAAGDERLPGADAGRAAALDRPALRQRARHPRHRRAAGRTRKNRLLQIAHRLRAGGRRHPVPWPGGADAARRRVRRPRHYGRGGRDGGSA